MHPEAEAPCGPELSIVVPVYRCADRLAALAETITGALEPLGFDFELILVNDGSTDRSWK